MSRPATTAALLSLASALLLSCGSGSSHTAAGSLAVTLAGPGGVATSVRVTGPGGYDQVITATTTLTGLAPGSYALAAAPARVAGTILATVYDGAVSGSPATVTDGGTATASVSYAARAGTGHLWVTDKTREEIQGYSEAQLASSGSPLPDVVIGTGAGSQTYGLAIAPGGALWVSEPSKNQVARFDPSQLATSGNPTPAATLATGFNDRIFFDRAGNLWIDKAPAAAGGAPSLVRYDAAGLTGTGALAATAALSWTLPNVGASAKSAFDPAGNLWVLNSGDFGSNAAAIMRVDAASLSATGTPAFPAAATLTSSHVYFVQGAAFDGDGALWIAVLNTTGSTPGANLVRYGSAQLAVTGAHVVDPQAVITVTGGASLGSLAFDQAGDLWIADFTARKLFRMKRAAIVGSGSLTVAPDVTVSTPAAASPGLPGLALDPPPAALPLAQ